MPVDVVQPARLARRGRGVVRTFALVGAGIACLLVVAVTGLWFALQAGVGSETLRREAEASIGALLGTAIDIDSGNLKLALDDARLLAIEIPDISLSNQASGERFASAGSLRVGLHPVALAGGRIELASVGLSDARIVPATLPGREPVDWSARFRNARDLIEPDLVGAAVFDGLARLFRALEGSPTKVIRLDNIEMVLGEEGLVRTVGVDRAVFRRAADGRLSIEADIDVNGRRVAVSGSAEGDAAAAGIRAFDLSATVAGQTKPAEVEPAATALQGMFEVRLSGEQPSDGQPDRIALTVNVDDGVFAVPESESLVADADLAAIHLAGSGKIDIERLTVSVGRSRFVAHGAVQPAPATDREAAPAYRFELVSDGSTIATADAPEPAITAFARIAGAFRPDQRRLDATEIGVRTTEGEIFGRASVGFAPGKSPSVVLAIDIPRMAVAHAKQIWPYPTAPGARSWVLGNVYGGVLRNSSIRLGVPAGRLGNGVPLAPHEVTAHFEVAETRFDMTGDLPPVRDAFGVVDVKGSGVAITLSRGTVYMPTGRTVEASNGRFDIAGGQTQPIIGRLDIDVAGDAPSVIEFASYKPIDAMRYVGLAAEDFSGRASGNVKAEIPLQADFPADRLDWQVDLAYEGLGIAKPFDGQTVSDAKGTIVVDPSGAVIAAEARLNGAPAKITMTEPLTEAGPKRSRKVTVTLDDKAREKIAPGLSTILSGPVVLEADISDTARQPMTADLSGATLDLPWVGWTKGKGIPATTSFVLEREQNGYRLADFALSGKSFSASGEVRIAGGELASVRFPKVALNRGDDASVTLQREGRGYTIDVRGAAFDARSIVKLYLANTAQAEKSVEPVPVKVSAKLDRVTGFGSEVLSGVNLAYRGSGVDADLFRATARTDGKGDVEMEHTAGADGRSMKLKSNDGGSLLRFLNIYEYMEGGSINLALAGGAKGPLRGQADARNFSVVNEPKLKSLVGSSASGSESLSQAVRRDIDVAQAVFERGFANVEKGDGSLKVENGVLRGPVIGATFQGTLYDARDRMDMTGTFMPAYGINRIFGEIPLFGQILGNGRDRGLIGVTFRLAGDVKSPQLQINPLSAIAPGIFRSIFEFN